MSIHLIIMKKRNFLFLLSLLLLAACGDDEAPITLSQNNFQNIAYDQESVEVDIRTSLKWTATSMVDWCKVVQAQGTGSSTLQLQLETNIDKERTGTVKIWTEAEIQEITIHQQALPAGQEYHYRIPVIFHVLYSNLGDENQYVSHTRLAGLLKNVNAYYRGETLYQGGEPGVDMNLEFVAAETDEEGNQLEIPGVEYVKMDNMPIDCENFMSDQRYVSLLWDPNRYINVMLYNFAAVDGGSSIILGISHLPLSISGANYLEGLPSTSHTSLTKENLSYPKCVSINSLYVYEESDNGRYNPMDANVTLAHELGHHLGLLHAFDENENGGLSSKCIDSDYCEDTPSYNRMAYMTNLQAMLYEAQQQGTSVSMAEAVKRENCRTGETFSSYNLMDYEISYSDRFTNDQRTRIRHVLTYSPLTPGPKKTSATTRAAADGPLDLPMVIVK